MPTTRGDSVPSRWSSPTGGLGWTIRWQIYYIWYLLRVFPLRNIMHSPCSKDGGMVHRWGEDIISGTRTRTRKKILIHSLTFSSISHNSEHLSSFLYFTRQWCMAKYKKRYDGWSHVTANKWCYQGQTSMHMGDESFAKNHIINHIDVHQYNLSLKLVVITGTANLVPSHSHQASANQMEIISISWVDLNLWVYWVHMSCTDLVKL